MSIECIDDGKEGLGRLRIGRGRGRRRRYCSVPSENLDVECEGMKGQIGPILQQEVTWND